jgi:hypothetical protein
LVGAVEVELEVANELPVDEHVGSVAGDLDVGGLTFPLGPDVDLEPVIPCDTDAV